MNRSFACWVRRRLPWINLPTVSLLALLQRTPVVPLLETAGNIAVRPPLGLVLKSALAVTASLGAVHSLAGATTLTTSTPSPLAATVGNSVQQVALGVKGTETLPQSFTISGAIPPGLTLASSSASITSATTLPKVINGTTLALSGIPTTAGTFDIGIVGWEGSNGTQLSTSKYTYRVVVSGGATATKAAFTTQPKTQTIAVGKPLTLTVAASGSPAPTFQWKKGTTVLAGKTSSTLKIAAVTTTDAGSYTCVATNSAGSVTSAAATVTVKSLPATPTELGACATGKTSVTLSWAPAASTAATSPTGYKLERATNAAFTTGKKSFTLGVATSYADSGLAAATTYYYRVSAVTVAGTSKPTAAATVKTLATVATAAARLSQVIARVYCGTGTSIATGGFAIAAGAPRQVLIRAVGPTLSTVGVTASTLLKDPVLELSDPSHGDALIAVNDNWKDNANAAAIATAITKVKATPFASTDKTSAALLLTLPPGVYSFAVTGKSSTKGIVLIEVYDAN